MKKVAWVALAWGCGSPAFVGGVDVKEDGGSDVVVVHEARESAPDDSATDAGADEGLDADEPDAGGEAEPAPPDGPLAQCCDDEQCGGVACNRGQCSGTYTTCDEPRCWAWCVRCLGKSGGHCPPLHPTQEVFCECED